MSTPQPYFEALHAHDDPWGYRSRWYEARKRALLLASLPRERFARGWELGCANGELTAALAPRCATLLATDLSARAVAAARVRTGALPQVEVRQAAHPRQWPAGRFDLIVFGEVGYYLDAEALDLTVARLRDSLDHDGVLIACHWLAPFDAAPLDGRSVHARIARGFDRAASFGYEDGDVLLEGWSVAPGSVAQREGLR
ncbi:SAM-dependent methyltransferase [Luteimonas sp. RD2P54]|uniref:SAM-dependent methyltransferase n=1 Tax=Luteimonas endophytica TaxID=3042023 RepID=A0ABT6JB74_9GAMM|nr:SAM-dependent methyltransferase [Luteimonas endophytica]MDH5824082.1 SAM-dependent methyltransferase [Luteimonas endophytica]